VIFVGFRDGDGVGWQFPHPTHTQDALLWDQWVSGEYWERHEIARRCRPDEPLRLASRIARLRASGNKPGTLPWLTVRDALAGLPDPEAPHVLPNHEFQPGARAYPGHTGSPLDEPAKTLKAGDHGVPGGENMLAHTDGRVRYFTVRESARLQTFPDEFVFHGPWSEAMRQLGNAVPVRLAEAIASSVFEHLSSRHLSQQLLGV
jgi:DNA (cytosine-5)-methyltransferase 1